MQPNRKVPLDKIDLPMQLLGANQLGTISLRGLDEPTVAKILGQLLRVNSQLVSALTTYVEHPSKADCSSSSAPQIMNQKKQQRRYVEDSPGTRSYFKPARYQPSNQEKQKLNRMTLKKDRQFSEHEQYQTKKSLDRYKVVYFQQKTESEQAQGLSDFQNSYDFQSTTPSGNRDQRSRNEWRLIKDVVCSLSSSKMSQEFIPLLRSWVGQFLMKIAEKKFFQLSKKNINYKTLKIDFSWEIIDQMVELCTLEMNMFRSAGQSNFGKEQCFLLSRHIIFLMVDTQSKNALEYLMKKYPPSHNKVVDCEMDQSVKEVENHLDISQFDMIHNANMDFNFYPGKTDFTRDIKVWLNILTLECKTELPKFEKVIKNFFRRTENKQSAMTFSINSKIKEGTAMYTDEELNQPGLKLKGGQMLRIIQKWFGHLLRNFTDTQRKIIQAKYSFKSKSKSAGVNLTRSNKVLLAKLLTDVYQFQILPIKQKEKEFMSVLAFDIMAMAVSGFKGFEYLSQKEVTIAKVSQYFGEITEAFSLKMLNTMLQRLYEIGEVFGKNNSSRIIDLVTFQVMDLLRCRCVGSKSDIIRIYREMMEETSDFDVVRVKNKLKESTKDIIVNIKLKNSFLICEVQLSVGDQHEELNDHFCHYFYQLHRSSYNVIFECASILLNNDPRMEYFTQSKNIDFKSSAYSLTAIQKVKYKQNNMVCNMCHPECIMELTPNSMPFCCLKCCRFVPSFSYYIECLKCPMCCMCLCPECIVKFAPLESTFVENYKSKYTKDKQYIHQFFVEKPIVSTFEDYRHFRIRLLQLTKTFPYLLYATLDSRGYKTHILKNYKSHIINAFYTVEQIPKTITKDSRLNWNIIKTPIFPVEYLPLTSLQNYKKFHSDLEWFDINRILKLKSITHVFCIRNQKKGSVLIVDILETSENIRAYKQSEKIKKIIQEQNIASSGSLQLAGLNICNSDILSAVLLKANIKILNLLENHIENIDIIRQFRNVQELYMERNLIKNTSALVTKSVESNSEHTKYTSTLPKLRILDLSCNKLQDVDWMDNVEFNYLTVLELRANCIQRIPLLRCPVLKYLMINENQVKTIDQLEDSQIQYLKTLNAQFNKIDRIPTLNCPKLQFLQLNNNKIDNIEGLTNSLLDNLETLQMKDNCILVLPRLENSSKLAKFDISNNNISCIQKFCESKLQFLTDLDLGHNKLGGKLPVFDFARLKRLSLNNNNINNIGNLSDSCIEDLVYLNLAGNQIENLPVLNLKNLIRLFLQDNKIISVSEATHWRLPSLTEINLSNNLISADIPKLYFENLQNINFENNLLNQQSFIEFLYLIPKIMKVYLAGNPSQFLARIQAKITAKEISGNVFITNNQS